MNTPKAFGGVSLALTFACGTLLVSTEYERGQRLQCFSNDFLDREINGQHQEEMGDDCAVQGFPDDGSSRYMKKRSYADWYL